MSKEFQQPSFLGKTFTCPFCGAYSQMKWHFSDYPSDLSAAMCVCCERYSVWIGGKKPVVGAPIHQTSPISESEQMPKPMMVYPLTSAAPPINPDIPQEFTETYNEAAKIFSLSPKGSAALLRLCLQKVCNYLTGNESETIKNNIMALQKTKLIPEALIQMAHTLRVMGNEAVHPGEIDFDDTPEIAYKLFGFINFFMDAVLSREKEIKEFFESQPPKIQGKIKQTTSKQQEE